MLGSSILEGENVVIEYYEPAEVKNQGKFNIGTVVHVYRGFTGYKERILRALNGSGDCNYDVGCTLGNGWGKPN